VPSWRLESGSFDGGDPKKAPPPLRMTEVEFFKFSSAGSTAIEAGQAESRDISKPDWPSSFRAVRAGLP
jgi:hypothetical protein